MLGICVVGGRFGSLAPLGPPVCVGRSEIYFFFPFGWGGGGGGGGSGDPHFFLQISFSWVEMSFYVEFYPPVLPRAGQKVCGGWLWW